LPNPLDVFDSLVPFAEDQLNDQIFNAMAAAGFTGNRYGTSAQRSAAEIGGEAGLALDAQLSQLLYGTFINNQQMALQAALGGGQLGLGFASILNNQLNQLGNFGRFEQGRGDDIASMLYNSFQNNQYGLLPLLLGAAQGQNPQLYGFPSSGGQSGLGQATDPATLLYQLFQSFGFFN
jgi:hypothetical protein